MSWNCCASRPIAAIRPDSLPSQMFSEEFQEEFLEIYHRVFDALPFVCGEHVWNFADFAAKQGITRVGGNKKGVFTRDRQPKSVARLLRARWISPENSASQPSTKSS